MHQRVNKEILSPSSEIINKRKCHLMIFPVLINLMFGANYMGFIYDVRDEQDKIFHIKDESICMASLEWLWSDASYWL